MTWGHSLLCVVYRMTYQNGINLLLTQFWQFRQLVGRYISYQSIPNLSQREVFALLMCHPVQDQTCPQEIEPKAQVLARVSSSKGALCSIFRGYIWFYHLVLGERSCSCNICCKKLWMRSLQDPHLAELEACCENSSVLHFLQQLVARQKLFVTRPRKGIQRAIHRSVRWNFLTHPFWHFMNSSSIFDNDSSTINCSWNLFYGKQRILNLLRMTRPFMLRGCWSAAISNQVPSLRLWEPGTVWNALTWRH